jgi:hypothetical protein
MLLPDRDDLQGLLAPHEAPCVSLFLPTHRHPPQSGQDPVRLRNLLREADRQLTEAGLAGRNALLEPVVELADSRAWGPPGDGLAVFRSPDVLAHYSLPAPVPERVVVADTFHVRPLLRFLQANQRYYVLALSQKRVQLFQGTPFSLSAIEVPELPSSLREALGAEHDPAFLKVRASARGSEAPMYHGHGGAEEAREEDLRRYFRMIDAAAWRVLREERAPLFLAGVVSYVPLYRGLSRYPFVAEHGIEGNFDEAGAEDLRERAWPLVQELFRERREQALEELIVARGRRLAELDLRTIGRHAIQGRVRRLFLGEGGYVPGVFDFETGEIRPAKEDELSDEVLDDLAQAVVVRDGEVMTLPAEEMPEEAPVAALLRW